MAITSLVDLANVFQSGSSRASSSGKNSTISTLLGVNGDTRLFPSAVDLGGLSQAIDLQSNALALRGASNHIAQSGSLLGVAGQGVDTVQGQYEQLQALAAQAAKTDISDSERQDLQKQADTILAAADKTTSTTRFQNISLLDGSFNQSSLAESLNIKLPDLSSAALLKGKSFDLSSAASATAALSLSDNALSAIASGKNSIAAQTEDRNLASATLASALQNQAAANSSLSDGDTLNIGSLLSQNFNAAASAQGNKLQASVLDLLNG